MKLTFEKCRAICLLCVATAMLAACGQMGPLYQPLPDQPAAQPPATANNATDPGGT